MRYILEPFNGQYGIKDTLEHKRLEWIGNKFNGQKEVERMNHAEPIDSFCSSCLLRLMPNDTYQHKIGDVYHSLCAKCSRQYRLAQFSPF